MPHEMIEFFTLYIEFDKNDFANKNLFMSANCKKIKMKW